MNMLAPVVDGLLRLRDAPGPVPDALLDVLGDCADLAAVERREYRLQQFAVDLARDDVVPDRGDEAVEVVAGVHAALIWRRLMMALTSASNCRRPGNRVLLM
ncbi:hypothetical protein, partial [Bacillus subtilis]|uniref:hypothetical protein n=1 Tax=Bacillus subtilis TaxID=1423 RepID=UPI00203D7A9D